MVKLDNYIEYLFYFFSVIIGAIIYIIYHTVCESLEGIDNSKIILGESNKINIQKYKEAYCNINGNGLFISIGLNIDNSGSIVRKGHPYLYNGGLDDWGYIWDPERNNNILECGYKSDGGTSGCFNKKGENDKCDCNEESHKNLFKIGDFCMISGDQNSTCIKDFLNSDRDGYKDEYNEFIYLRNLPGETISERFQNIPMEKRPDALIKIVNYNTLKSNGNRYDQVLSIFHEDTNILLANYDNKEKELYLYDVTTVKNYEEYIKTHRYYNESEMIDFNRKTENSINFLDEALFRVTVLTDDGTDDGKDIGQCEDEFKKNLDKYGYSIFQAFNVFGINSFDEHLETDNNSNIFTRYLINYCNNINKNLSKHKVLILIADIINNIEINKKNLNGYVNKTKENINC